MNSEGTGLTAWLADRVMGSSQARADENSTGGSQRRGAGIAPPAMGSRSTKRVPRPGWLDAATVPPKTSAIRRTIARPSPTPDWPRQRASALR